MKYKFNSNCDTEAKIGAGIDLQRFTEEHEGLAKPKDIDTERLVYPNHACIWNDVNLIGNKGAVIATNELFSIVIFEPSKFTMYRNEDLDQKEIYE